MRILLLLMLLFFAEASHQPEYHVELVRVVDGDTVIIHVDLGMGMSAREVSIRLARIDAPEPRGAEREQGLYAAQRLREYLLGGALHVQPLKQDSFGRWVAEIRLREQNVSDWLVEQGLAEYRDY